MLQAVTNPEIAVEATLQPIRRFGFDAAILFSDLTLPFIPMGAPFDIVEGKGPVLERPVRSEAQIKALKRFQTQEEMRFVIESIKELKKQLLVPLIGFTGAPFTLASYLIEGGPSRDLAYTKSLMLSEPDLWGQLMELLSDVVIEYLRAQIEAGVDAVQIFDSWVGSLSPQQYEVYILPSMQKIFHQLKGLPAPVIHFGTGNPLLLPLIAQAGGDVIGIDYRVSLTAAGQMIPGKVLQGNLDPTALYGSPKAIRTEAVRIIEEGRHLHGHIFNLGHGILPMTPLENVEALVDVVCNGGSHAR